MTAGKGDTRRPAAVSAAEFAERWRATFSAVVKEVDHDGYDVINTDNPQRWYRRRMPCDCPECTIKRDVANAVAAQLDTEIRRL